MCLRILMRDVAYQKQFSDLDGITVLAEVRSEPLCVSPVISVGVSQVGVSQVGLSQVGVSQVVVSQVGVSPIGVSPVVVQWLKGKVSDSRLRGPRFESCAAV